MRGLLGKPHPQDTWDTTSYFQQMGGYTNVLVSDLNLLYVASGKTPIYSLQ